ncbi:MAG TPA: TadE family protein [Longimicrobiaceae bacterium]|nr:TadE family protein [Longimicrobiaceae bacterium]
MRRSVRDESGAALVEFAIAAPMLIFLILGMVEFAEMYRRYQVLTDTAREGVRRAVVSTGPDSATVVTIVKDRLKDQGITPRVVTVHGLSGGYGAPATVRIEYDYPFSFVSGFMGPVKVPLKTQARMRIE